MKRKRVSKASNHLDKRRRVDGTGSQQRCVHPMVPLLKQYYHEVLTLRHYLTSRLPKTSKKRRRRLMRYETEPDQDHAVTSMLDTILVGTTKYVSNEELDKLDNDITVFTQQLSDSDITIGASTGRLKQAEVGICASDLIPFSLSLF